MSRIDIGLGRHGPLHDVRLRGRPDDPVLSMEVPRLAMLCLTAKGAEEFALAILGALEAAGVRRPPPPPGVEEVTRALVAGTLSVADSGVAVPEPPRREVPDPTRRPAAPDPQPVRPATALFPENCLVSPEGAGVAEAMHVRPDALARVRGVSADPSSAPMVTVMWEHDGMVRAYPAHWLRRV